MSHFLIVVLCSYSECRYAEAHIFTIVMLAVRICYSYAECWYAEAHIFIIAFLAVRISYCYAKCRYAECRFGECRGVNQLVNRLHDNQLFFILP